MMEFAFVPNTTRFEYLELYEFTNELQNSFNTTVSTYNTLTQTLVDYNTPGLYSTFTTTWSNTKAAIQTDTEVITEIERLFDEFVSGVGWTLKGGKFVFYTFASKSTRYTFFLGI